MDEAYPYVAARLLCDEQPRLRAALRYMVRHKPSARPKTLRAPRILGRGRTPCGALMGHMALSWRLPLIAAPGRRPGCRLRGRCMRGSLRRGALNPKTRIPKAPEATGHPSPALRQMYRKEDTFNGEP